MSIRLIGLAARAAALLLLSGLAFAQADSKLLGDWVGTSEANRGEKLTVKKDVIVIADDTLPYKIASPGVIVLGDDIDRLQYRVDGDTLTLTSDGESVRYRRTGAAPIKDGAGTPSGIPGGLGQRIGNPLGATPADAFARGFEGDGVKLVLEGSTAQGYRGSLTFRGATYPVRARADGTRLAGQFEASGSAFEFTASLAGNVLTLATGGKTYRLEGEQRAAQNPLGGDTPAGATGGASRGAEPAVVALEGVDTGRATRWDHPRGWFSFDMPEGWSVYQQNDTGMLLNPGLTANDTLDAIVGLAWGRLEAADRGKTVVEVMDQYLPQLRAMVAQQGLTVGQADGPVQLVKLKDVPGGVQTFKGRTGQGKSFQLWFGGIVKRDHWLAVSAIVLDGKEARFLPRTKLVFASLEPKPPERNEKLEAALVGRTFQSSQYGKLTGSAHHAIYAFGPGGAITRRVMSNVISKPGSPGVGVDAERGGRYEVIGDVVYMYFETGQEAGQVLVEGGQVAGIRIGSGVYR